jgi:hypothetical protein
MSKNIFTISKVVTIILVGTILENFENQLIMTNMASVPFHLGHENPWKHFSIVHSGLTRVNMVQIYFIIELNALALDTNEHKMFYAFFHFKLIETFTHYHPCGFFTTMFHNRNIIFFLHDSNVNFSSWHINARLFPLYQSLFQAYALDLSFCLQLREIMLCKGICHINLPYFSF